MKRNFKVKSFVALIYNYVVMLKFALKRAFWGAQNLSRKSGNKEKETGFKNGRLLAENSFREICNYNARKQQELIQPLIKDLNALYFWGGGTRDERKEAVGKRLEMWMADQFKIGREQV